MRRRLRPTHPLLDVHLRTARPRLAPERPCALGTSFQIQCCPSCGYCAEQIGQRPRGARRAIESIVYRDVLENARMPELARQYFCAALVAEAAELRDQASSHFLSAAWACDDSGATEQARICRNRAAEMLAKAIEWGDVPSESPVVHGVRADMLRRAGRYDEAVEALSSIDSGDGGEATQAATVLAYIRELAEARDDGPHSVAEAFASED